MRLARETVVPELLQWFGLLGAPLAWTGQFVYGFGFTVARCGAAGRGWALGFDPWELTAMCLAATVALAAEACAIALYRRTRGAHHFDAPPLGRRHFFVSAAVLGNALFVVMILLSGFGTIVHEPCRQA